VTAFPSCIPHFTEDQQVKDFFTVWLGPEWIDDAGTVKPGATGPTAYAAHLREALEFLLRERPATPRQWARLTQTSFWTEEDLYAYLQALHDHFYGDRPEAPEAPPTTWAEQLDRYRSAGDVQAGRTALRSVERQIAELEKEEAELDARCAEHAADAAALARLDAERHRAGALRADLEQRWLDLSDWLDATAEARE
jgi:hypothetical protein